MTTYRERRLRRAEQLRGWAGAREAKQAGLNEAARADEAATGIPFGQPIIVGHHSERRHRRAIERIDRAMGAAVENGRKAEAMATRADEIEAQAARSIYSDDADAVERLREKLAALEAKRERIKAFNASCRKAAKQGGVGDTSLLDEADRRELAGTAKAAPYMLGAGGQMPRYKLTNLGGVITSTRKRLAQLERNGGKPRDRVITARFGSDCTGCGAAIEKGDTIRFNRADGARCRECGEDGG